MKAMNIGMGIFLMVVAVLKLADWKGFVGVCTKYDLIAQYSKAYAFIYHIVELALGVAKNSMSKTHSLRVFGHYV